MSRPGETFQIAPPRPAPPSEPVFEIVAPAAPTLALVCASPHSGTSYPADFLADSSLDLIALRKSEDSFVDEIFADAPALGAPLLKALFPRAFVDPNREPYELDPEMFEDDLPEFANTTSPRVAAGLGTIARVVANGEVIHAAKLRFAEAMRRIEGYYRPYHEAQARLVAETRERCGFAILLDCHSMPSIAGPEDPGGPGHRRADAILGDCFGTACASAVIEAAEATLRGLGYSVRRNAPYAGGFTTRHYGRPGEGVHALQIELNRALYMDERRLTPRPGLATLREHMARLVAVLGALDLRPAARSVA